jgi:hypothetical protein
VLTCDGWALVGRRCSEDFSQQEAADPLSDRGTYMADQQSSELVRELRKIRFILAGILLLLALNFAIEGYLRWAESHYRPAARSQEFHDSHGELRAIHDELGTQRNPPTFVIPGEKVAAREENPSQPIGYSSLAP